MIKQILIYAGILLLVILIGLGLAFWGFIDFLEEGDAKNV